MRRAQPGLPPSRHRTPSSPPNWIAAAVVAAIQAYTKINAAGQWIDRSEHVNLNELFERMTTHEMEDYAREGTLPAWFKVAVGATTSGGQEA